MGLNNAFFDLKRDLIAAGYPADLADILQRAPLLSAAGGSIDVSQINATGTPSATTFLRGDGQWATAGTSGVTIGTYGSQSASANGLVFSGGSLYAQSADATHPGMVSTGAQTWAGVKTFNSNIVLSPSGSGRIDIGMQSNLPASAAQSDWDDTNGNNVMLIGGYYSMAVDSTFTDALVYLGFNYYFDAGISKALIDQTASRIAVGYVPGEGAGFALQTTPLVSAGATQTWSTDVFFSGVNSGLPRRGIYFPGSDYSMIWSANASWNRGLMLIPNDGTWTTGQVMLYGGQGPVTIAAKTSLNNDPPVNGWVFDNDAHYTFHRWNTIPLTGGGVSTTSPDAYIAGSDQAVDSATASAGALNLSGGNATGSGSTGNGGPVNISGGTSVGGSAGPINLKTAGLTRVSIDKNGNATFSNGIANTYQRVASATSGGTTTINNNTSTLILHSSGTLATHTVTMPASPVDGQLIHIGTNNTITTLTVQGNTGQTMASGGTLSSFINGATYMYVTTDTAWYQVN
jgi:hypothetical protein